MAGADDGAPPAGAPQWLVGDLHVHVSPPDDDGHSKLTVASAVAAARKAKLDFLVVTPHAADRVVQGETGQALVRREADAIAAPPAGGGDAPRPFVVSGWEFTRESPGHLGVSFVRLDDLARVPAEAKAGAALGRGALVVVNHPFFRPVESDLAFMKGLEGDRRWRPFFGEGKDDLAWNAIEVWHERSVLVQKAHSGARAAQFPATQMVADALAAWDRATLAQKRRIVAVGGSDCHGKLPYAIGPMAMVAVRVREANEEGLRRGLLAAHVTFGRDGGRAAGDFAAASDVEGASASVGDSIAAKGEVRLSWSGKALLVEDGVRVGEFEGGAVRKVDPPGSFRFWRIEKPGDAFSNMIYANLP
jgi:hypothetical protein